MDKNAIDDGMICKPRVMRFHVMNESSSCVV